jgi:SAM-dependent methyltransferase
MARKRPYYHDYAWAYDLLQTDAAGPRVDFVQRVLAGVGIVAGALVVDAGCGTGRYAVELAERGFRVHGVDRSADLLAVARGRAAGHDRVTLECADLLDALVPAPVDAILCRGVLNDVVEDAAREAVFRRFGAWLRPGGVLIFDVREWSRSAARHAAGRPHEQSVALPDGTLRFRSETTLVEGLHGLHVRERFDILRAGAASSAVTDFVMRCWTAEEVAALLGAAGLDHLQTSADYGEGGRTWSDRMVVVARKPGAAQIGP